MKLAVNKLAIPEVLEIRPKQIADDRGFFSETYNQADMQAAGIATHWVQDNHVLSREAGVLRGLHYQAPPRAQAKLLRVTHGAIYDVAVDIRRGSPTFGQYVGVTLSAAEWNQLFIPEGFAHGYLTLEPMTEVIYKVSDLYSREHDRAIAFDDPEIGIEWPLAGSAPILSDKDRGAPKLAEQDTGFVYERAKVAP